MLKINTYSIKGVKSGELALPKEFDVEVNISLLAQAVRIYEERGHVGLRQAKTRSEVNRTTKKLYKQKGTGGARHGSRRANVFVGGGVVFGPRAIRREINLPTALKSLAKMSAYAYKAEQKSLVAVEDIKKLEKTKSAADFLKKLGADVKAKRFTFVLSENNKSVGKFIRNIKNATPIFYKESNAFDIYKGGMVILDADIFAKTEKTEKAEKTVKKSVTKTK